MENEKIVKTEFMPYDNGKRKCAFDIGWRKENEIVWINPDKTDYETGMRDAELTMADIHDAEVWCRRRSEKNIREHI